MNRLKYARGYLCGAMDRELDGGEGWRVSLQKELSDLDVFWLDPTHKPIDIGTEDTEIRKRIHLLKYEGNYDEASLLVKPIRCVDLRMVDISDFLIVHIDIETHPCGTYEELYLANREKKPIIVCVKQGKENSPNWLLGAIPHKMIFSSWDEVYHYVRHIAHDSTIDTVNRWFFFDFTRCRQFKVDKT